jgi:AcrR family transcriptional regulator
MATGYSLRAELADGRVAARRQVTIETALDHAELIVAAEGAGAVTVSEVARRMGMRPPSLYKYFPSLHAIFDALFARGNARVVTYVEDAVLGLDHGLDRLLVGSRAIVRWAMLNRGLAPLLYWRPIPGFVPSPASYAQAGEMVTGFREDLHAAALAGELDASADTDDTLRLLTAILAGIGSQQLANQPDASYEDGIFTALTDRALAMFVDQHRRHDS